MSFSINMNGAGTHAGWRKVKMRTTENWTCPGCKKELRYYWAKCPNCNHPKVG